MIWMIRKSPNQKDLKNRIRVETNLLKATQVFKTVKFKIKDLVLTLKGLKTQETPLKATNI
jgi:hypothetical protein